jgi:uncharacterized protein YjbJ (UPF0337 family)
MAEVTRCAVERGVLTATAPAWEVVRRRTEVIRELASRGIVGHEAADQAAAALDLPRRSGDKISNKAEEIKGKAKEAVGKVTGGEELEAEGTLDQGKSGIKQAGESLKDGVKDIKKSLTD